MAKIGVRRIVLIGAEPLLRQDIGPMVRKATDQGMRVTVFTNGCHLAAQARELVQNGMDRLVLSLDGPEAIVHDGLRGSAGVFDAALEGWHLVGQEARNRNIPVPQCVFHTTVSIANARVIPQMFRLAKQEKAGLTLQAITQVPGEAVEKCRRGRYVAASRQYMNNDGEMWLSQEEATDLKQRLRHLGGSRNNLSARVLLSLSNENLITGTFPIISCAQVHHTISVNPQGVVYPCGMLRNYHLGSTEDSTISEIWKGKRRREFLKSLKQELFPVCKYCCHYLNNLTPWQVAKVLSGMSLH
jgi:radical SAM protein with 4Fe4S-binding SPASM domain